MTGSPVRSTGSACFSCLRCSIFCDFSIRFSWRARSFERLVNVVREVPAIDTPISKKLIRSIQLDSQVSQTHMRSYSRKRAERTQIRGTGRHRDQEDGYGAVKSDNPLLYLLYSLPPNSSTPVGYRFRTERNPGDSIPVSSYASATVRTICTRARVPLPSISNMRTIPKTSSCGAITTLR